MQAVADFWMLPSGALLWDYAGLWVVLAGLLLLWPADLLARWLKWSRASTIAGVLCVLPLLAILAQVAPWESEAATGDEERTQAREDAPSEPRRERSSTPVGESSIGFGAGREGEWLFDADQAREIEAELRGMKLREFLVNPPEQARRVRYHTQAAMEAGVFQRVFARSVKTWTDQQLDDATTPRIERARALLVYGKRAEAAEEAALAAEDDDALWAEAKLLEGDAWLLEGEFERAFQAFNEGLDFPPGPLTPLEVQQFLLGRASAAKEVLEQEKMPVEQKLMYLEQAAEDFSELAQAWEPDQVREEAQSYVWAGRCQYARSQLAEEAEEQVVWLEQAVDGFQRALQLYQETLHPMDSAWVQYSLGDALLSLHHTMDFTGDLTAAALQSVGHLEAAAVHYERAKASYLWGGVQDSLGRAYMAAATHTFDPIDAEALWQRALTANEGALSVYGRRVDLMRWAQLQASRGRIQRALAQLASSKADEAFYFRESTLSLRRALTACSQSATPEMWGNVQVSLGLTYQANGFGFEAGSAKRDELMEASVVAFKEALKVLTEDAHALNWAQVQGALGTSYQALGLHLEAERCFENFRRHNPDKRLPTGPLAEEADALEI